MGNVIVLQFIHYIFKHMNKVLTETTPKELKLWMNNVFYKFVLVIVPTALFFSYNY